MRIYFSILLPVLLLMSIPGFSQFRKYSNEFLNIGAGARGLAMGGAQVASVKDETAGYWNPAGLTRIKDKGVIGFIHADYFGGIAKYDYLAGAMPIQDNKRALGVSILRFAVDDIPNTLFLVEPDGSINYGNIQTFSSADYAFLLSFAQKNKRDRKKEHQFWIKCQGYLPQDWKICYCLGLWPGCRFADAWRKMAWRYCGKRYYHHVQRMVVQFY